MDLSEARGWMLFRGIRGGIEITQRLGAVGNPVDTFRQLHDAES
jgi:hypothetical protein